MSDGMFIYVFICDSLRGFLPSGEHVPYFIPVCFKTRNQNVLRRLFIKDLLKGICSYLDIKQIVTLEELGTTSYLRKLIVKQDSSNDESALSRISLRSM